jgi:hypothetical protein
MALVGSMHFRKARSAHLFAGLIAIGPRFACPATDRMLTKI